MGRRRTPLEPVQRAGHARLSTPSSTCLHLGSLVILHEQHDQLHLANLVNHTDHRRKFSCALVQSSHLETDSGVSQESLRLFVGNISCIKHTSKQTSFHQRNIPCLVRIHYPDSASVVRLAARRMDAMARPPLWSFNIAIIYPDHR